MFNVIYDNYSFIFIDCIKKFYASRYRKMTPVDLNLYKTANLPEQTVDSNGNKKCIKKNYKKILKNVFHILLLKMVLI